MFAITSLYKEKPRKNFCEVLIVFLSNNRFAPLLPSLLFGKRRYFFQCANQLVKLFIVVRIDEKMLFRAVVRHSRLCVGI